MSAIQKSPPLDFKTQYALGSHPQDDEIVVDFFCGGGGAGTGLEMGLGRKVNVAKNHSAKAISMHTINHPGAGHFTTDVFDGDPDAECGGKAVGWFHMSPDFTHHSQAAGGQPRKHEICNLSWIGLKWAGKKRPRVISLENVKQILQWGPLIAKRDKATGRIIKLVPGVNKKGKEVLVKVVAAPGEIVPVGEQFLVPNPKRKGSTWKRFVDLLEQHSYVVEWRVIKGTPYVIVDIRLRMLQPAELYRVQGFPPDYIITHGADGKPFTKTEQVHMCGNSVSPPPMAALARANDPWRVAAEQAAAA
ncbi:DNA cytosine methyltransferase [Pseudomonas sp. W5-36]